MKQSPQSTTNLSASPSALAVDFNALLMVPFVSDQFIELGNKWHHQQKGNEAWFPATKQYRLITVVGLDWEVYLY